jgi:hypothetical protein
MYQLQPLDVGLFNLLSTVYLKELNNLIHKSLSIVSITKRLFYLLFCNTYRVAFTKENIFYAFKKPSIYLVNLNKVLDKLRGLKIANALVLKLDINA